MFFWYFLHMNSTAIIRKYNKESKRHHKYKKIITNDDLFVESFFVKDTKNWNVKFVHIKKDVYFYFQSKNLRFQGIFEFMKCLKSVYAEHTVVSSVGNGPKPIKFNLLVK